MPTRCRQNAFTLIELLIVIGVIALMTGALAFGLRGSSGAALRSAQGTIGSLLSAARSQAALHGADVVLLVNTDSNDRDGYLHTLYLAQQDPDGGWRQTGGVTVLPDGIYVVPSANPPMAPGVAMGGALSTLLGFSGVFTVEMSDGQMANYPGVCFDPRGLPTAGGKLVLATAKRQREGSGAPIRFDNASRVRGIVLSDYGAVTFINDVEGLQ